MNLGSVGAFRKDEIDSGARFGKGLSDLLRKGYRQSELAKEAIAGDQPQPKY